MGSVLDSAKNIRQDKKDSPRQAHKVEEKLAKDKDKGVKMLESTIQTSFDGHSTKGFIELEIDGIPKKVHFAANGSFDFKKGKMTNSVVTIITKVPFDNQLYVASEMSRLLRYDRPTFIYK